MQRVCWCRLTRDLTISHMSTFSLSQIDCTVRVTHKTGVEMEALTGASVAALTVYDMLKGLSHDIVIEQTQLLSKTGGKRHFNREDVRGPSIVTGQDPH